MKKNLFLDKTILSEDRIKVFILSSLFCALIMAAGCGNTVTMHKVDDVNENMEVNSRSVTSIDADTEENLENNKVSLIKVHVCGAVQQPGVYEIEEGSRVIDAVELAGGFTDEACQDGINLAIALADSNRVYIPSIDDMEKCDASMGLYSTSGENGTVSLNENDGKTATNLININTAGESELQRIPGIGETRAKSIIAYRQEHGHFNKKEDIQNVSGIGPASYEKMKDVITVE